MAGLAGVPDLIIYDMVNYIRQRLFDMQDLKYRDFQIKLIPGVEPDSVIGVRTPQLRGLARELAKDARVGEFLDDLPHRYYDERNLHGFIISEIRDYDECMRQLGRFLPTVDNWATCDLLSPRAFKQKGSRQRLVVDIRRWMDSAEPFIIRFGIGMLMAHFLPMASGRAGYLDDDFRPEYLEWVSAVHHDHYYVRMMVAWFFATALAKQWDAAVPYIQRRALDEWTHRKAIQKARESYRITAEQKEFLLRLR